jgi:ATP synthase protein I
VLRARTPSGKETQIDKKSVRAMSQYGHVGIFFGVAVVLGLFGGRWLDQRFHCEPWFTLLGVLVGVAAGFRELYRVSKQALKEEK